MDGVCVARREGEFTTAEGGRFGDEGLEAEYEGDDGVFRRATSRVIPPRTDSSVVDSASSSVLIWGALRKAGRVEESPRP